MKRVYKQLFTIIVSICLIASVYMLIKMHIQDDDERMRGQEGFISAITPAEKEEEKRIKFDVKKFVNTFVSASPLPDTAKNSVKEKLYPVQKPVEVAGPPKVVNAPEPEDVKDDNVKSFVPEPKYPPFTPSLVGSKQIKPAVFKIGLESEPLAKSANYCNNAEMYSLPMNEVNYGSKMPEYCPAMEFIQAP